MNKTYLTVFVAAAFIFLGIAPVRAQVIDFDDLEQPGTGFSPLPSYSRDCFVLLVQRRG